MTPGATWKLVEVPDGDDLSAFSGYNLGDVTEAVRSALDELDDGKALFEFRLCIAEGMAVVP